MQPEKKRPPQVAPEDNWPAGEGYARMVRCHQCNYWINWQYVCEKDAIEGCPVAGDLECWHCYTKDPLRWNEFTEMKYHLRYQRQGLNLGALAGAAKKACDKGEFVAKPHGQNFIDLEVYHVRPGKPLRLHASKPYAAQLRTIFPTIRGIFGPLALMVPATIGMLQHEYTKDCMSKYRAKVRGGAGPCKWIDVPSTVRRTAWPTQSLARVDHLLCFR